jgi:ADP-dependent NAD(P)H-hydrate dehydratase / NAD(P)H-hydrate epimerase
VFYEGFMRTFPDLLPASWPAPYPLHGALLTSEARSLDRAAREAHLVPEILLMERAALGVASCTATWAPDPAAQGLVLCGPGDNGGDGFAAARILAGWGRSIRVLDLAADPARGPAARTQRELCLRCLTVERIHGDLEALGRALHGCAYVIDGLFGVGLTRPLEGWWCQAIERVNVAARPVLSIDLPSGLDGDSGEPRPVAIVAEVTATMAAPKRGLLTRPSGARHAGRLVEIDIGLPWALHAPYRLVPRPEA